MSSTYVYRDRFGSLFNAYWFAGIPVENIDPATVTVEMSDVELLDELSAFYCEHGRAPKTTELTSKNGMSSDAIYVNHFGSLYMACWFAGIPEEELSIQTISLDDQTLLDQLFEFFKKSGRAPSQDDLGLKNSLPSSTAYSGRFGGLLTACRLAGIPDKAQTVQTVIRGSADDALLDQLFEFFKKSGRAPSQDDLGSKNRMASCVTYANHFGSLYMACWFAGIPEEAFIQSQISVMTGQQDDQTLLNSLLTFYLQHGHTPTVADLGSKSGMQTQATYHDRFGGLVKACLKAGIPFSALNQGQRSALKRQEERKKTQKKKRK